MLLAHDGTGDGLTRRMLGLDCPGEGVPRIRIVDDVSGSDRSGRVLERDETRSRIDAAPSEQPWTADKVIECGRDDPSVEVWCVRDEGIDGDPCVSMDDSTGGDALDDRVESDWLEVLMAIAEQAAIAVGSEVEALRGERAAERLRVAPPLLLRVTTHEDPVQRRPHEVDRVRLEVLADRVRRSLIELELDPRPAPE